MAVEAPGAQTLVLAAAALGIWFTHIRMFLLDQDPMLGKRRGRDKALYGDWGEGGSERADDVLRPAGMMERREKGTVFSKVLVSLLCFPYSFVRCLPDVFLLVSLFSLEP
jgi:hypothetical protein